MSVIRCNDYLTDSDIHECTMKRRLLSEAASLGPSVTAMVESIWVNAVLAGVAEAIHLLHTADAYPAERLDAACSRALYHGRVEYRAVQTMLLSELDRLPLQPYVDIEGNLPTASCRWSL